MAKELRMVESSGRTFVLSRYFRLAHSQSLSSAWRTWAAALVTEPCSSETQSHAEVRRLKLWQTARAAHAETHARKQVESSTATFELRTLPSQPPPRLPPMDCTYPSKSMLERIPADVWNGANAIPHANLPPPQVGTRAAQFLAAWKRESEIS